MVQSALVAGAPSRDNLPTPRDIPAGMRRCPQPRGSRATLRKGPDGAPALDGTAATHDAA